MSFSRAAAALLLLLSPAAGATDVPVTSNADAGAGTLRQAITDMNALPSGPNAALWGTGGTVTLLSDLPAAAAAGGTTLDFTTATSSVTIQGAPNKLQLGGAVTVRNDNAAQSSAISAVVSGAGSLIKSGQGELVLTGANTYAGGTKINPGVLKINADAALGALAGALTFNGGELVTTTGLNTSRALVLADSGVWDTRSNDTTLSGVISGGGSIAFLGVSSVTLSGSNTYSGGTSFQTGTLKLTNNASAGTGTITFNGGTLMTGGGLVLANGMTFNAAGATFNTSGSSLTLSGSIGGEGALNVLDVSTLTLNGSSGWSGGTTFHAGMISIGNSSALGGGALTFNGGTLQAATTMTFSNGMVLNAAGGTIDTVGSNLTLSGTISGAGALTVNTTGVVVLSGNNSYAGGTVLKSGMVVVNGDANLGAAAGGLTFNGGTLRVTSDFTSARALTLNAGGGTFDTNGNNARLTGAIGGAGAFTKAGSGQLTLAAASNYGGATTVGAGTLALGVDSALPAATALTVASGATLDLNTHTQTVASYAGGGATSLVLKPGVTNLTVTGNANLTGATLRTFAPTGTLVKAGDTFTVLSYGSLTGTYASIIPPAALSLTPAYGANSLVLTVGFVPFATTAATGNQSRLGAGLEAARANPSGDTIGVLGALYNLDAKDLRAALDQMSPVSLGAMQGVGMAGASVQSAAVGQRMATLADGSEHPGFAAYGVSRRSSMPGTLVAAGGVPDYEDPMAEGRADGRGTGSPWGLFASGVATAGKLAEANSPDGSQPGYAFNSGGLTLGGDYRLSEHLAGGGSLGYLKGHASIDAPASGTIDDESVRYGVYGTAHVEKARANLYLGGAKDFFRTNRGVRFGTIDRTATGKPTADEFNADLTGSFDLETASWGTWSPFGGLSYDRVMIGRFAEEGAGALDLDVDAQTAQSLLSTLGLKFSEKFKTDDYTIVPYLSLGWRHELENQSRPITARFSTGVGAPFTVSTGDVARDGTQVGAGVSMAVTKRTTLKLDYTGDFRSHYQATMVGLSGRLRF